MNSIPHSIPYPWQQGAWQNFLDQLEQGRLPHALLVSGPEGIGKWHYAHCMANYLLCQTPKSGLACGECRSCQLVQANTHPDKWVITPEEKSRLIKVDQIRHLSAAITETARQAGRKVVILEPAELLNINAANALLKNLEEPTKETFFIVVSHMVSGVMATIRSRCQILSMAIPDQSASISWLQELGYKSDVELILSMAAGAPLRAKMLFSEPVIEQLTLFYSGIRQQFDQPAADLSLANEWQALELEQLLDWWLDLIHRMLVRQKTPDSSIAGGNESKFEFVEALLAVEAQSAGINPQWLYRFTDKLLLLKKQFTQGANPNRQLLVEELLLDWYAIIKTAKM